MWLLRRFLRLSPTDRRLLIQATILLTTTRFALVCLRFRIVSQLLDSRKRLSIENGSHAISVEQISWAIQTVSRRILTNKSCLVQALVANWFLRRNGHDSELRIGVAKESDKLAAHAWVECQGKVVVGGGNLVEYTPLGISEEK